MSSTTFVAECRASGALEPGRDRARRIIHDLRIDARNAVGLWPSAREQTARVLAHDFGMFQERYPSEPLPVSGRDSGPVLDALRHFAGRRARRGRAVLLACAFAALVGMSVRDGNGNHQADILDLVAAGHEIAGFSGNLTRQIR